MTASSTTADGDLERLLAADAAAPLDATGLADVIALLAKANRDEEASLHAARLLKLRPTHKRALRALTRAPRPEVDAIGGWRALAVTTPEDPEPWLQIARLAARAKDAATTLEACEEVLARSGGHLEALGLKLGALSRLGSHGEIGATWRQLHEVDVERAAAVLTRATEDEDADVAVAMLAEAAALGALGASGEHQRQRWRSLLTVRAFDAEVAGDAPAAALEFAHLKQLCPTLADHADGFQRAVSRLSYMIAAAESEPDAGLIRPARVLARFEPDNRDAHLVLGRALARTGAWSEAADALTEVLRLDDVDGSLWLEHADACARCGRLDEAAASWKRATSLAGADLQALAAVGRTQEQLRGVAETAYDLAVERGAWRVAWAARDALADLRVDDDAMETRTGQLIKATAKALCVAADEHRPETIDLAHLFLERAPGDVRARLFLGRTLIRERRNAEALEVWRALAADRPDSVEPQLQIARVAKRLAEAHMGRQAADAVLALEPGHAEARDLRTFFDAGASMG